MALPKIDVPIYNLTLPSTGKEINFRPFLVKEEKMFLMASESEDKDAIMNTTKQVLRNCILNEDVDIESLPVFDIEFIFFNLRARSVGEIVDLKYKCNNTVDDKVCGNVEEFKINLLEIKPTFDPKHEKNIKLNDKVGIVLKYPDYKSFNTLAGQMSDQTTNSQRIFELITDCIDYIYDKDEMYYAKDTPKKELVEFLESLNKNQFAMIENFFETMPKLKHTLHFKCKKCKHEEDMVIEGIDNFFT